MPDPTLSIGEGAIAPWSASASNYYEQLTLGDHRALRRRSRHAVAGPAAGAARLLPLRHERRQGHGPVPQPLRAQAHVHDRLRRDRHEPRAALQGDRLRLGARENRGVHVGRAVPGLRGRAAAARVARGARRRARHPRVHGDAGAARAGLGPRAGAERAGAADRAARAARDRGAAARSWRTSASATCRWIARRRRCRAARRSGSGSRRRSARRSSACSTSSTSRRSACTSATTRS